MNQTQASDSAAQAPRRWGIDTLTVIGVGLIGGSLALALKRAQAVQRVIGVGRSADNLQAALSLGVIDAIEPDPRRAASCADVICLALPVNAIGSMLETIQAQIRPGCVVTDVGSVKRGVAEQAVIALGAKSRQFVPGHPVAGKEKSGVRAALADLFVNHKVVLTPLPQSDSQAVATVQQMWQTTGAQVMQMDATQHDRVLSITSHLPHVLAYTTVQQMANSPHRESCYAMAAGGFYDFTRIASGDAEMWRDICLMNRDELLPQLKQYQVYLRAVVELIENSDAPAIHKLFADSQQARSVLVERRQQLEVAG